MPGSYVSNHVHIVFSTKNRLKTIREELQPALWTYMAGIAKNHGMNALAISGISDHAHVLLNLGSTLNIAKGVQVLKANSSRWMNEHPGSRFEWQGILRVQRQPVTGRDNSTLHREPAETPPEYVLCEGV